MVIVGDCFEFLRRGQSRRYAGMVTGLASIGNDCFIDYVSRWGRFGMVRLSSIRWLRVMPKKSGGPKGPPSPSMPPSKRIRGKKGKGNGRAFRIRVPSSVELLPETQQ